MSRSSINRVSSRAFQLQGERQAIAYERMLRRAAAAGVSIHDLITILSDPRLVAIFIAAGKTFALKREFDRAHKLVVGTTGAGKSVYIRLAILIRVLESAMRAARCGRDLDAATLDTETLIIDPKDDAPRFKAAFAAMYCNAPAEVQRVLAGSFRAIELARAGVTPYPLLRKPGDVSLEFAAELAADEIVVTSPAEWTATMRALLYQLLRLLLYLDWPFDIVAIRQVLRDRATRERLLERAPRDLRDFFGHMDIAPQTVSAVLRRLEILLSYPEVRAMLSVPSTYSVPGKQRRIVVADCGTQSLPPSIGLAVANLLVTEAGLQIGTRDRRIERVVFIDELAYILSQVASLLQRYLNVLRVARSSNTFFWAALQSMQGLPSAAVEEILTNVGQIVAFQSRDDVAAVLAPHIHAATPGDTSRASFTRELASLPPREAFLWVKSHPAFRVRTVEYLDPARATGMSEGELIAIFDEVLSPHSRLPIGIVDAMLDSWRAEHLPNPREGTGGPSLDDLFGGDE